MEKIASFTIDHNKLQPGIYVSRKDHIGAEETSLLFLETALRQNLEIIAIL